jgi:hypothetical protein
LLASALLFLPIYVLYSTPDSRPGMKLGWIGLFTLLFAVAIPVVTNARRAEVFAACAAYAAVLVVFVSGNIGAGGTGGGGSRAAGRRYYWMMFMGPTTVNSGRVLSTLCFVV